MAVEIANYYQRGSDIYIGCLNFLGLIRTRHIRTKNCKGAGLGQRQLNPTYAIGIKVR